MFAKFSFCKGFPDAKRFFGKYFSATLHDRNAPVSGDTRMRTDMHRPSVIIPANYTCVETFTHARYDMDGQCVDEGFGLAECANVLRNIPDEKIFGNDKKCGSCGARFLSGALWRHDTTGEFVFMGRDCSDSMDLVTNWGKVDAAIARATQGRKLAMMRHAKQHAAQVFMAQHAGLEDALSLGVAGQHRILTDMSRRLLEYGSLSDKQVSFALKLAEEVKDPSKREKMTTAPTGRVTFTGSVVSLRDQESMYGIVVKATIKVATPDGAWLAWLSVPGMSNWQKGDVVTVTATLTAGRDPHFAIGKRPVEK